jgi:hypothetical protein
MLPRRGHLAQVIDADSRSSRRRGPSMLPGAAGSCSARGSRRPLANIDRTQCAFLGARLGLCAQHPRRQEARRLLPSSTNGVCRWSRPGQSDPPPQRGLGGYLRKKANHRSASTCPRVSSRRSCPVRPDLWRARLPWQAKSQHPAARCGAQHQAVDELLRQHPSPKAIAPGDVLPKSHNTYCAFSERMASSPRTTS